jgi:YesN/AraC family two-component response regulator
MPHILYAFPRIEEVFSSVSSSVKEIINPIVHVVNENTLFTDEYILHIQNAIQLCVDQKLYLLIDFDKGMLSHQSKIIQYHLNYYFKEVLKIKFTDWRNELRVEYAKKMLQSGYLDNHKLESLAHECGFANHVSFFSLFKKYTDLTPKEFLKQ